MGKEAHHQILTKLDQELDEAPADEGNLHDNAKNAITLMKNVASEG